MRLVGLQHPMGEHHYTTRLGYQNNLSTWNEIGTSGPIVVGNAHYKILAAIVGKDLFSIDTDTIILQPYFSKKKSPG
jgi:hypothetical protein